MKNLGIIYLIFVVLLSALPCSDEFEAPVFNQNIIANVDHGKQQGGSESCSPICLCTCCGQSIIETEIISFSVKNPTLKLLNLISIAHFKLAKRDNNIWQPPKLV